MGAFLSTKSDERDIQEDSFMFDMGDSDFTVLNDLLPDILVHVPTADLLNNCRIVCKAWKEVIDGHSLWKEKCEREKRFIPYINFTRIPDHFYRLIYFHDPYGRNLIINPCGQDGLDGWELTANGGDGFVIENPPVGADVVPSVVGSQSCFATACLPCEKHQIIDLYKEGIPKGVLEREATKIQISEWYAARFDCASKYVLRVTLLSEGFCYHDFDTKSYDKSKLDEFNFHFREEQFAGRQWKQVTHDFKNVGKVRYIIFQHYGKDSQYWAGNYGSKMTGASVKIAV